MFLLFHKLFHNEKHSNKDLLPSHRNKALLPSHDEDEDVNAYLQEILEAMDDDMMDGRHGGWWRWCEDTDRADTFADNKVLEQSTTHIRFKIVTMKEWLAASFPESLNAEGDVEMKFRSYLLTWKYWNHTWRASPSLMSKTKWLLIQPWANNIFLLSNGTLKRRWRMESSKKLTRKRSLGCSPLHFTRASRTILHSESLMARWEQKKEKSCSPPRLYFYCCIVCGSAVSFCRCICCALLESYLPFSFSCSIDVRSHQCQTRLLKIYIIAYDRQWSQLLSRNRGLQDVHMGWLTIDYWKWGAASDVTFPNGATAYRAEIRWANTLML